MTPETKAVRRQRVQASDMYRILSLCPHGWGGPIDAYMDKLGLLPDSDSESQWLGRVFEGAVAKAYSLREGVKVRKVRAPHGIIVHPTIPWIGCSPDREVVGLPVWLECKRTGQRDGWGDEGTDQIPGYYLVQVQWQLLCAEHLGIERVDVAVDYCGQELRIYRIFPSEEIQDLMLMAAAEFWDRVQRRDPPPIGEECPHKADLLNLLYPPEAGTMGYLEGDLLAMAKTYREMGQEAGAIEKERSSLRDRLLAAMGTLESARLDDGTELVRRRIVSPPKMSKGKDHWELRFRRTKDE